MKKILLALFSALFLANPTWPDNLHLVNYQGRLTIGGVPATGSHTVRFRIYSQPNGGTALPGYDETFTLDITNPGGIFNVMLGTITPNALSPTGIPTSIFVPPGDRFVGINVDGGLELDPRTPLVSVPYAFHASSATSAETLQPGATIQGDLSIAGGLQVGDGTIHLASPPGANLANAITITQLAGQNPPQIRTSLGGAANITVLGATGGTQLTINAGAGGNLNLNTISTGTVRIGSGATGQTVILQTTSSVNGNLTVNGRLFGDGSGLTGVAGLVPDAATLSTVQTFTGAKTFSAPTTFTNNIIANTAGTTASLSTTTVFGNLNVQGRLTGDGSGLTGVGGSGGTVSGYTSLATNTVSVISTTYIEENEIGITLTTPSLVYVTASVLVEANSSESTFPSSDAIRGDLNIRIDSLPDESPYTFDFTHERYVQVVDGNVPHAAVMGLHRTVFLGAGGYSIFITAKRSDLAGMAGFRMKKRRLTVLVYPGASFEEQ